MNSRLSKSVVICFLFMLVSAYAQLDVSQKPVIQNFAPETYQAHHQNWDICQDHRGILYFGNDAGIVEFDGSFWKLIELPNKTAVYAIHQSPDQRLYVGGAGEMGYVAPDTLGVMRYISLNDKLAESNAVLGDSVFQVQATADGAVFLTDRILAIYNDGKFNLLESEDHFFGAIGLQDQLFIIEGTHGLSRLVGEKLETVPGGQYIRANVCFPFQQDKIIIITTNREILLFDPVAFTADDGESTISTLKHIRPERRSSLPYDVTCGTWIDSSHFALGSIRNGCLIYNIQGDQVFQINTSDGLLSDDIYGILRDANGHLWLSTNQGISFIRLPYVGENVKTSGEDSLSQTTVPFNAIIRSCENTINDSLLFGGAFYKDVDGIPVLQQTDKIFPVIPYQYNALRFTFSSTELGDFGNIEYQTFLDGFDRRWSRWNQETRRDYTNIPEGNYTFRVRAKKSNGQISDEAEFSFQVLPPWYREWWAYTIYGILAVILILLLGYFQRKRLILKAEEEKEQALIEAENQRRKEEMEKARDLQLSMLPTNMPKVEGLDIAAHMKTATEVGGDYYDCSVAEDGSILLTIGDATGHGINAGMVVTSIKSLFFSSAAETEGINFYDHSNATIDEIFNGELLMALQLVRIKDSQLTLITAGMPPAYYYHAKSNQVEEVFVKAMPLGIFPEFPYEEKKFTLEPGDTLLLASDGLAELFNSKEEMFGYDQVRDAFSQIATKTSQEIIDSLLETADVFRQDVPNDDDLTFLVIKKL